MIKYIFSVLTIVVIIYLLVPTRAEEKAMFIENFQKIEAHAIEICGKNKPEEWAEIENTYQYMMVEFHDFHDELSPTELKIISKCRVKIIGCQALSKANTVLSPFFKQTSKSIKL